MDDTREGFDDDCGSSDRKAKHWWKRQSTGVKAGLIFLGIVLGLAAAAGLFVLFGNIVMWLWNWIMPYLFDLPTIDFWMAWGIVVLSMILFGRASSGGGSDSGRSKKRKRSVKVNIETTPKDDQEPTT